MTQPGVGSHARRPRVDLDNGPTQSYLQESFLIEYLRCEGRVVACERIVGPILCTVRRYVQGIVSAHPARLRPAQMRVTIHQAHQRAPAGLPIDNARSEERRVGKECRS